MYGISTHYYSVDWDKKGSATEFGEAEYFDILQLCLEYEEILDRQLTVMDKYDPEKNIALIVDEWGTWHEVEPGTNPGFLFQQNTLRDAMVAALSLNYFNARCERIKMANIAQTVNVLQAMVLTEGEKMLLTPTYHVFEMYRVHHDATLLPVSFNSPDYEYDGRTLAMISTSASRSADGSINLSIVNIDPNKGADVTIELRGTDADAISGRIVTGERINSYNTFEDRDRVKPSEFKDASLKRGKIQARIPAKSIVVLKIK